MAPRWSPWATVAQKSTAALKYSGASAELGLPGRALAGGPPAERAGGGDVGVKTSHCDAAPHLYCGLKCPDYSSSHLEMLMLTQNSA